MTDLQECEVCGGEKPADMVERTTVSTIAPLEADVCQSCQLVQDHEFDEGCIKCGETSDGSFYFEVEFPLGSTDLPARMGGGLCGSCAEALACELSYDAVDADSSVREELVDTIDRETEHAAETEAP